MHYVSYYRLGYQTAIIKLSNERLFDIYNNGYVNYFYPLTIVRHTRMNQQLIFFLLRNKAEKLFPIVACVDCLLFLLYKTRFF